MGTGFLPHRFFTEFSTDVMLEMSVDPNQPLP